MRRSTFFLGIVCVPLVTFAEEKAPLSPMEARKKVGSEIELRMVVASAKDRLEKRGEIYLDSDDDFKSEKNFAVVITKAGAASYTLSGNNNYNRGTTINVFADVSAADTFGADRRLFEGILALLYAARRRDPGRGGLGILQIEKLLGCPAEHLEFHLWYVRQKGWTERLDSGLFAITAAGIDRVVEGHSVPFRRDRLLAERNGTPRHAADDEQGPRLAVNL